MFSHTLFTMLSSVIVKVSFEQILVASTKGNENSTESIPLDISEELKKIILRDLPTTERPVTEKTDTTVITDIIDIPEIYLQTKNGINLNIIKFTRDFSHTTRHIIFPDIRNYMRVPAYLYDKYKVPDEPSTYQPSTNLESQPVLTTPMITLNSNTSYKRSNGDIPDEEPEPAYGNEEQDTHENEMKSLDIERINIDIKSTQNKLDQQNKSITNIVNDKIEQELLKRNDYRRFQSCIDSRNFLMEISNKDERDTISYSETPEGEAENKRLKSSDENSPIEFDNTEQNNNTSVREKLLKLQENNLKQCMKSLNQFTNGINNSQLESSNSTKVGEYSPTNTDEELNQPKDNNEEENDITTVTDNESLQDDEPYTTSIPDDNSLSGSSLEQHVRDYTNDEPETNIKSSYEVTTNNQNGISVSIIRKQRYFSHNSDENYQPNDSDIELGQIDDDENTAFDTIKSDIDVKIQSKFITEDLDYTQNVTVYETIPPSPLINPHDEYFAHVPDESNHQHSSNEQSDKTLQRTDPHEFQSRKETKGSVELKQDSSCHGEYCKEKNNTMKISSDEKTFPKFFDEEPLPLYGDEGQDNPLDEITHYKGKKKSNKNKLKKNKHNKLKQSKNNKIRSSNNNKLSKNKKIKKNKNRKLENNKLKKSKSHTTTISKKYNTLKKSKSSTTKNSNNNKLNNSKTKPKSHLNIPNGKEQETLPFYIEKGQVEIVPCGDNSVGQAEIVPCGDNSVGQAEIVPCKDISEEEPRPIYFEDELVDPNKAPRSSEVIVRRYEQNDNIDTNIDSSKDKIDIISDTNAFTTVNDKETMSDQIDEGQDESVAVDDNKRIMSNEDSSERNPVYSGERSNEITTTETPVVVPTNDNKIFKISRYYKHIQNTPKQKTTSSHYSSANNDYSTTTVSELNIHPKFLKVETFGDLFKYGIVQDNNGLKETDPKQIFIANDLINKELVHPRQLKQIKGFLNKLRRSLNLKEEESNQISFESLLDGKLNLKDDIKNDELFKNYHTVTVPDINNGAYSIVSPFFYLAKDGINEIKQLNKQVESEIVDTRIKSMI